MKAGSIPYTIEFPGEDEGKYADQYRTLTDQSSIWLVNNNENMDNGSGTPKEELGLEPGDSGTLEFRIQPNGTDSITVDICFTVRGIVKQHDQNNSQQLTEITDTELMGFVASHIMLFSGIDSNGKYTGLIENSSDLKRYLRHKTYSVNDLEEDDDYYTKLYWVWPFHLSDLISTQNDDLIYASNERSTVIQYIVDHKDGFFKDITTEDSVLSADLNSMEAGSQSCPLYLYDSPLVAGKEGGLLLDTKQDDEQQQSEPHDLAFTEAAGAVFSDHDAKYDDTEKSPDGKDKVRLVGKPGGGPEVGNEVVKRECKRQHGAYRAEQGRTHVLFAAGYVQRAERGVGINEYRADGGDVHDPADGGPAEKRDQRGDRRQDADGIDGSAALTELCKPRGDELVLRH